MGNGGAPQNGLLVNGGSVLRFVEPSFTVMGDLWNAGTVSLVQGSPDSTLTVTPGGTGNYIGAGGVLALDTVLESDGAPSDRLIVDGGSAIGGSGIAVSNAGGSGDLTSGDGILVVEAVNGGTTAANAFYASGPIAAGPFEYLLFRGDAGGAGENWYLRSRVIDPVLRPEVPGHIMAPELAYRIGLAR